MIIYGSRMYGKKDIVRGQGYCDHCGTFDKHESYYGRKFGHIYFIPLIPSGPRMRVIKECKKCSNGIHIPETQVPELVGNLKNESEESIAALLSGKIFFLQEGEELHCAETISGYVDG